MTKVPEAARAAALAVKPRARRPLGPDGGRAIVAGEALRRALGTHQATLFETSTRLAQRLA